MHTHPSSHNSLISHAVFFFLNHVVQRRGGSDTCHSTWQGSGYLLSRVSDSAYGGLKTEEAWKPPGGDVQRSVNCQTGPRYPSSQAEVVHLLHHLNASASVPCIRPRWRPVVIKCAGLAGGQSTCTCVTSHRSPQRAARFTRSSYRTSSQIGVQYLDGLKL